MPNRYPSAGAIFAGASILFASGSILAQQPKFDFGKREYVSNCAVCHGLTGKGDGVYKELLNKSPSDLTSIAKANQGVLTRYSTSIAKFMNFASDTRFVLQNPFERMPSFTVQPRVCRGPTVCQPVKSCPSNRTTGAPRCHLASSLSASAGARDPVQSI